MIRGKILYKNKRDIKNVSIKVLIDELFNEIVKKIIKRNSRYETNILQNQYNFMLERSIMEVDTF